MTSATERSTDLQRRREDTLVADPHLPSGIEAWAALALLFVLNSLLVMALLG